MKSTFADHFSSASSGYAAYRPTYPAALFDWLAASCIERRRAWDCGTGNGQAAVHLAHHFHDVIATDPSNAQIEHRKEARGVHYGVMSAEASAIAAASIDLVTVAQALHWFNLARFYQEVRRVVKPGGAICVWTYGLLSIADEIDGPLRHFYRNELGGFWPAERALVDDGYGSIDFPFRELTPPAFEMHMDWTLSDLAGFLATWSAVTRYQHERGYNPVPAFIESIATSWGDPAQRRRVRWPLEVRAALVRV